MARRRLYSFTGATLAFFASLFAASRATEPVAVKAATAPLERAVDSSFIPSVAITDIGQRALSVEVVRAKAEIRQESRNREEAFAISGSVRVSDSTANTVVTLFDANGVQLGAVPTSESPGSQRTTRGFFVSVPPHGLSYPLVVRVEATAGFVQKFSPAQAFAADGSHAAVLPRHGAEVPVSVIPVTTVPGHNYVAIVSSGDTRSELYGPNGTKLDLQFAGPVEPPRDGSPLNIAVDVGDLPPGVAGRFTVVSTSLDTQGLVVAKSSHVVVVGDDGTLAVGTFQSSVDALTHTSEGPEATR